MKRDVQSLSICVPGKKCINECVYCVARMNTDLYKNQMDENLPFYDLYLKDYINKMAYAKEQDANIMMITGDVEPLQNRHFLQTLALINNYILPSKGCGSFNWIEIQTSGVMFNNNYARFLRNTVGVSILSLSLSSFDNKMNAEIQGIPEKLEIDIKEACRIAKEYDFTLRLSLNMNKYLYESVGGTVEGLFNKCRELGADQVTFRKLFISGENSQTDWILENKVPDELFDEIDTYIVEKGEHINTLPYGYKQYIIDNMSAIVDIDCMNEEKTDKMISKYFVLRPDCKIYDGWNKEDLIF